MSKILSDKVFVKEYELATNEHILDFFRGTIKFCADLLLSLPFSFLAVLAIIISKTEDILIFALILILFSTPLFILSIFTIYESYIELKQYRYRKELFLAEIGMSMKDAKRRYKFIMKEAIYVQSLQKICKLNPQTRSGQVEMIKNWYKFKDTALVEYLLDNEYNESDFNMYVGHFEIKNFSEKKSFAALLFKLAILEDGIHNDEWEVLMKLLVDLNFDGIHIDFFKNRYGPLRTESENSSNNENTSTKEKSISLLKPYYDLLGLEVGASEEEIKKAYHNLALQHHPDMKKNAGRTKECEEMMAKINEAVEKIRG
jgi:DnaJ-domain-containing protein 1